MWIQNGKSKKMILNDGKDKKVKAYKGVSNMTASNVLAQTYPIETDMSEKRGLPLGLIWLRRLVPNLHRYDWDAPKLAEVCKIKFKNKFLEHLSHISVNAELRVSVITLQTLIQASQSVSDRFGVVILAI